MNLVQVKKIPQKMQNDALPLAILQCCLYDLEAHVTLTDQTHELILGDNQTCYGVIVPLESLGYHLTVGLT